MPPRRPLPAISSLAWEHPADAAALQALRQIPGFDLVVRKVFAFFAERTLHLLAMAGSLEVGPRQVPRLHRLYEEVLHTLDAPRRFPLYVAHSPFLNAGAVGMDEPFLQLNSALVNTLDDDALRYVLGHELGHILSGHVLYKTMARVMVLGGRVAWSNVLTGLAWTAVLQGLLEWDRKSELSADRAGLLAVQDPDVVRLALLRLAAGVSEGADIAAFREQARRYEEDGDMLDAIRKALALLGQRHPFPVHRLRELDRWVEGGYYQAILRGEYLRRGQEPAQGPGAWESMRRAADSYAEDLRGTTDPVAARLRGLFRPRKPGPDAPEEP